MSEEKIQELNMIENSLAQINSQKQQYQKQLIETDNAIDAIKDKKEAYHIVGTLMIKKDSIELTKELEEKKKLYEVRLEMLEKQESKIKKQAETLREELVSNLENK